MAHEFDIAVVGGGLAGSAAALRLAQAGNRVAFAAPPAAEDRRTTALLTPSIALLERLGVWSRVENQAAALRTMRIVDGTRRLVRAPTVAFHAGEIGEDAFGYNIANSALDEAFRAQIAQESAVVRFESPVAAADARSHPASLTLADGRRLEAPLIVAADGRNSLIRQAAGIPTRTWSYPQAAIVLTFEHRFAHESVSTEFHTESGPFTQVPLKGNRSSLVWVVERAEAERIAGLAPEALDAEVEDRMRSMLGAVHVDSPLQRFDLSGMTAERMAAGPVLLVGEAAHVFPPIGAQGLNLGLRDVAALGELRCDPASRASVEAVSLRYQRARSADVRARTFAIDMLNRSLLSSFLPVQVARAAGLAALALPGPLRTFALGEGLRPGGSLSVFADALRSRRDRLSARRRAL